MADAYTYTYTYIDWLDCEWGGPYDEAVTEEWVCLPIYGPVREDEEALGFLLIFL